MAERYGCIEGFPTRTFQGENTVSRYEFAEGLNSCLEKIENHIFSWEKVDLRSVLLNYQSGHSKTNKIMSAY